MSAAFCISTVLCRYRMDLQISVQLMFSSNNHELEARKIAYSVKLKGETNDLNC
jgi:hypothetical protein